MLSLGTEDFLAFWIASYSVGLPAGSPPPVRAATSMFLISLANILPRRASMTAFLCLVVAHLEWPLMMSSLVHRSGQSYRGRVGSQRGRGAGGASRQPPVASRVALLAPNAGSGTLLTRRCQGPNGNSRVPPRSG